MNEEKNLWTPSIIGRLISPPRIPDIGTPLSENKKPKGENIKDLLGKPLSRISNRTSNLRFRSDRKDNPFQSSSRNQVPILPTFSTWKATDNKYYYNLLKNKGPAKRKVTFGQTITISPSNLLSGKQLRYQTRYQTRSNNSPEESSNDNDNDNDDDNNLLPNR